MLLSYEPNAEPGQEYAFADVERRTPLLLLGALFAIAVVVLGRWTGLRALFGLGCSPPSPSASTERADPGRKSHRRCRNPSSRPPEGKTHDPGSRHR